MNSGCFYGMVTVSSSNEYTELALKSFFDNTTFLSNDQFVLIDNDGDWKNNYHKNAFSSDNLLVNTEPKNTSANINQIIKLASEYKQDVVFLSNDVIFTPSWNHRFIQNTMTIPSCNQTHDYGIPYALDITDFNYDYETLYQIANEHMQNKNAPFERLLMPTYVCCIPYNVYSTVGYFDEDFNVGGEDVDYRLRCLQNNIDFKYSNSFLLHFNGKSSWNGKETNIETIDRNNKYKNTFIEKWGIDLFNLCLVSGNPNLTIKKYELFDLIKENKFNEAIKRVLNYV